MRPNHTPAETGRYTPRLEPLPLFAWAAVQPATPPPRPILAPPRLLLLADAPDPDGLPRAALAIPGRRLPTLFPTLAAALDALRCMEVNR